MAQSSPAAIIEGESIKDDAALVDFALRWARRVVAGAALAGASSVARAEATDTKLLDMNALASIVPAESRQRMLDLQPAETETPAADDAPIPDVSQTPAARAFTDSIREEDIDWLIERSKSRPPIED